MPDQASETGSVSLSNESLVSLYLEATADLPTPRVFAQWAGIHAVGAAVERRVWTQFGSLRLYPNIYVFLVGPPGTGKTVALNPIGSMLRKSKAVDLAPNDVTKQGLLDALAGASKGALINGKPFTYHFLALHVAELSNFMSQYDDALAGLFTELFDCPPFNEEKKRGHDKGKFLDNPGISMIVGTATKNLGKTIGEQMWGSGFMARVILVYSADEVRPKDRFKVVEKNEVVEEELINGLARLGKMVGPMTWEPDAAHALNLFSQTQEDGAPLHNRLEHYVTRRWMHLAKLCMIAALSDERMEVLLDDFNTALGWIKSAEANVTEIFKDIESHEDGRIYEELRNEMWAVYANARKPIPDVLIYKWLSKRVASHQVERMFQIALAADYFRRAAGSEDEYIPQMGGSFKPLGVM